MLFQSLNLNVTNNHHMYIVSKYSFHSAHVLSWLVVTYERTGYDGTNNNINILRQINSITSLFRKDE